MAELTLLLALAALQAQPGPLRLECEAVPRRAPTYHAPMRLAIAIDVQGDRIASVLMAGAPLFSSYRSIRRGSGAAAAGEAPQLLPHSGQWRGHFQGRAIRLRRERSEMMLEPASDGSGAYSGFWTFVLRMESSLVEVNGGIHCRTVAGFSSESTRS
jgi:hypothetical protein